METENLGWLSESTQAPPPATLKPEPKDAGTAFFLSLVLPGAGQVYVGEKKRGWWTFFFFTLSLIGVLSLWQFLEGESGEQIGLLWGLAFRTALALYAFAFLDAYFTAREKSEGIYALNAYNPRVAAILNLLTRGFGYWYLDERNKGILLFVLVGIANRASLRLTGVWSSVLDIFVEVALAVMAVDAFRLAKKKNQAKIGEIVPSNIALAPSASFKPHIPMALAGLLGVAYVSLIVLGLVMPDYEKLDHSAAVVTEVADGKVFKNPTYGVELTIPAGWEFDGSDPSTFAEVKGYEGACSVSLLPDSVFPFTRLEAFAQELGETLVNENPGLRLVENRAAELAGRPAREVVVMIDVEGTEVRQNYVIVKNGLSVYALVITVAAPFAETCQPELDHIRSRVVIPH